MENNTALDIMLHGKTITFYRSLKDISCRELARISGVEYSTLHKLEASKRSMTQLSNYRITRALQSMGFDLQEVLVINLYVIQKHGGLVINE
ncbi:TPA: XRE family transcriptional regulator [Bacillus cereus]|nr:XRE family transcriptional regulator [Bacillus cereus]